MPVMDVSILCHQMDTKLVVMKERASFVFNSKVYMAIKSQRQLYSSLHYS
ncbi:rCG37107 [Rattus norvegicus]|uniref:RCG37107 n=1 Tax=Rattus norvegicus TaxID=10116 RepID=A6HU82_RAT|nr:rCG37107 [Rattus norvegicus]